MPEQLNSRSLGYMKEALALLQVGRPSEAKIILERACATDPRQAEAWCLLGITHGVLGDPGEAERCCRHAADVRPDYVEAYRNLGVALEAQNRIEEAIAAYREAMRLQPDHAELLFNLGNALKASGQLDDAIDRYRHALPLSPRSAHIHTNLGIALAAQNQLDEAISCYQTALEIEPDDVTAHVNLGSARHQQGHLDKAIACYRRAIAIQPDHANAHNNLGATLADKGDSEEAIACYRRAIAIQPDHANAHNNLGVALLETGHVDDAIACYRRAIAIQPDHADAHNNLGIPLIKKGRLTESIAHFRETLRADPGHSSAHMNLALALVGQGNNEEGLKQYECIPASDKIYYSAQRNRLLHILYSPNYTLDQLYAEHRRFESLVQHHYAHQRPHPNSRDLQRKLRIGYVSSDFRTHPVGHALLPLLEATDRKRFGIYLYAEVKQPDAVSARFRGLSDRWKSTLEMDDEALAECIREDGIDILVVLAGHFDQNRTSVCALKPAPIQVSFHDVATSGLIAMDYLITDILMSPRNTRECFTERLIRLPTFHLHAPIAEAPPPGFLPALGNGHVTFGSCNNPAKTTPRVIALWAELLKAVPGSTLLLKHKNLYADEGTRYYHAGEFKRHGIDEDRLIFESGNNARSDHLAIYQRMDIALDPFPFNGATTTFESLWMGVPIITLQGNSMVSRWGGSMLSRAGLPYLVSSNEEQYVECAKKLSSDLPALAKLRAMLREQVEKSPLCNAKARARQIERAYRYTWRKWCLTETSS